ncbi:probable histone acetyltransferase type B catalytic subunit [Dioscorea cayenensis subsp. rotundata]|uniref:histone acetyltransferase n=1 Tax=Dioscorea cayennensis subsp. rotundata TaxID=55577 RepID=A0AB40AVG4_DIOCR|nr:probable histone acetyltransferase type B catalytic subunit [Dioscorea cayenensis subsp. rotundata]
MALKHKGEEPVPDAKKRKRVGFTKIDPGIEANECIKVFLVKNQDEVGDRSSFCIDPVDLNQLFGEDGKIYGYKGLKIDIWLSIVSFHGYAEFTFESTSDGGKGITDLKTALQNIFGESLIEKADFLESFSRESQCIRTVLSDGAVVRSVPLMGDETSETHVDAEVSAVEVIRMNLLNMPVGLLYSRLIPLVLLLVEGGSPIDIADPRWEIYFVVKKTRDKSGDYSMKLLGFAAAYLFYHYPDSTRLRISQILVLPQYQGKGYGRLLLESVNFVAVSENVYDVTFEEPSEYLQHLRTCIDTLRLLSFEPLKSAINSAISSLKEGNLCKKTSKLLSGPPPRMTEIVRQKLKINKKQFLRCWEVLIYVNLDPKDKKCMDNFKTSVSDRVRSDILDKDSENNGKRLIEVPNDYGHDMTFIVFQSNTDEEVDDQNGSLASDQSTTQEEQLNQLVDKQMKDIIEIAKKVSSFDNKQ